MMLQEMLGGDQSISFEEFADYKFNLSYHPESDVGKMAAIVSGLEFDDPLLLEGQTLLAGWDFTAGRENRQAALGVLTIYFLADEVEEFEKSSLGRHQFNAEQVEKAFELAVTYLDENFGRLDPPWGEVQRLQRGEVDVPLGGGPDVLRAAYAEIQENGVLKANNGDGYIMLVAWRPDGSVESYSVHQFGSATIREESPHYDDQSEMFAAMQLKPVWFDLEEIMANLEAEYTPWTSTYRD